MHRRRARTIPTSPRSPTTRSADSCASGRRRPRGRAGGFGPDEGPAFAERTRVFDRDGNVKQVTDPRSFVTKIGYDAMGQPIFVDRPGSKRETNGTLSERREMTRFVYDGAQRRIAMAEPLAGWDDPA